jgi:hypothetical protein
MDPADWIKETFSLISELESKASSLQDRRGKLGVEIFHLENKIKVGKELVEDYKASHPLSSPELPRALRAK